MAEITSGENLTVMILTSDREVDTIIQACRAYIDELVRIELTSKSPHIGICQDFLNDLGWYDGE